MRNWLLEHGTEPEVQPLLPLLVETAQAGLAAREASEGYTSLAERLADAEWVALYLDLCEAQFWLNPTEGVRQTLPFVFAAAIYRRPATPEAVEGGQFFAAALTGPLRDPWKWAYDSLGFLSGRQPLPEELSGLHQLIEWVAGRGGLSFPPDLKLPDYRPLLEAALWCRLAECLAGGEDKTQALGLYDRALPRLPQPLPAEVREEAALTASGLAFKLAKAQQYRESLPLWTQAIELDPNDATAYYNRGSTYDDLNEYEQAIADYNRAIELDPNLVPAYYNRAHAALHLLDLAQVQADFSRSWQVDPTYLNAPWMALWCELCRPLPQPGVLARLEEIVAVARNIIWLRSFAPCTWVSEAATGKPWSRRNVLLSSHPTITTLISGKGCCWPFRVARRKK